MLEGSLAALVTVEQALEPHTLAQRMNVCVVLLGRYLASVDGSQRRLARGLVMDLIDQNMTDALIGDPIVEA